MLELCPHGLLLGVFLAVVGRDGGKDFLAVCFCGGAFAGEDFFFGVPLRDGTFDAAADDPWVKNPDDSDVSELDD